LLQPRVLPDRSHGKERHIFKIDRRPLSELVFIGLGQARELAVLAMPFGDRPVEKETAIVVHPHAPVLRIFGAADCGAKGVLKRCASLVVGRDLEPFR
jgi:hypothetical protein